MKELEKIREQVRNIFKDNNLSYLKVVIERNKKDLPTIDATIVITVGDGQEAKEMDN